MSDTIVAISTALGVASISVVRVSGKDALKIASKVAPKADLTPRFAHLTPLFNSKNELIDQGIVIYFQAPKSFTGEDIVEFQCHGGVLIAQEILESCLSAGARLAEAGEFSKRAFFNGKIDMTKAEAVAKMIEAKSVDALKILARQLKGDLRDFVNEVRDELLGAIAHSEVMIDYAEEDIPADIEAGLLEKLESIKARVSKTLEASLQRRGLIDGFKLAIIGKPNVGKSSLLNRLLNYERAIVSQVAGTTRDTIEESIRIGTHILKVVDTAGIRETADEVEKIGVDRSLKSIEEADTVLALFDGSREWESEDDDILQVLRDSREKNILVAISKSDLEQKLDTTPLKEFNPITINQENIETLLQKIEEILDSFGVDEELILSSSRQIEIIKSVIESIDLAFEPLKRGELEFFSYHLQEAIRELSKITTPYESEQILDKMFGEFCLGK
jgi:tRNA modification GTPase